MEKNYSTKLLKYLFAFLCFFNTTAFAQNWGFESTTVSTPPNNWSAVTGTWSVHTTPANVRSGTNSMAITDPATSGTTIGTTNPFVTVPGTGYYLITIGWGKSNTANNALFHLGYRSGTTNTLNPSTTSTGQPANLNDVTWSRITSVSTATVAAGNYGISLRAFRSASVAGTTIYIDDLIMYPSTSNVPDYTAPDPVNGVILNGNVLTWNNGIDNGAPASGIGGVLILRANGVNVTPPTINPQAMYDPGASGAAGASTLVNGTDTWTVLANIQGSATTTFTDASASGGPYTYAVYMRDLAYNYSNGVSAVLASPCSNPATAGTAISSASNAVCPGQQVNLNLTGNSFGIGQTYQWQSSSTLNGTYTNIGSAQSSTSFSVNPLDTTYYRCEVVCSSGSAVYSTPVQVNVLLGYSGTFTINASQPTAGNNYQTFAAAIAAMSSCGITGPVVFNVDSASGPFTSQIVIPHINGASATNTITINGNGALLNFLSTTTGERAGIKLNGTDYTRIKGFRITASGTATTEYGYGIQLLNDANHNIIENNTITINQTSTSTSNYAGILVNSTASAITTAGASLCDSNIIQNNNISGGYAGIALVGNGSTSVINGNKVMNNVIKDFYTYGIYLNGGDRTVIESNDISRPNRASVIAFNGVYLTGVSTNTSISKNSIHDPYVGNLAATTTTFAIYLNSSTATVGNENVISNNVIYNLIGATGNKNGVLLNASSNVKVYHNTIYLNDVSATCTACANRGIYVQSTGTTGLDFRNNNIYISSGGTAPKQCVFFEPTAVTSYTLENNNYYITSTTGTINEIARVGGSASTPTQGTGYITIADWKTGSAKEVASTSVDPLFVNVSAGNLEPATSTLNNTGVGVGITTDIMNRSRSTLTPDVGAYEFSILVSGVEMSAENIVAPTNNASGCYSAAEPVIVRIRNNSTQTINFAVNPVTVFVDVTGTTVQAFSKIINTDTLASNAFVDVTMNSTINLSQTGSYTITARTSTANDVNINNDTVDVERIKTDVIAGTVNASPSTLCVNPGTTVVTATGFSGYSSLQWQESSTSGTGFVDIPNATSINYTETTPITQTKYYRLAATCGSTTVYSVEDTVSLSNPQVLSTTPSTNCGTGTVTLSATGSAGTTLNWYDTPTGGVSLGTGNTFVTPVISSTTNYYVSASEGGSLNTVGPASPASVGTSGTIASPITTYYMEFQVLSNLTIYSVDIFPDVAIGSSGTIVIQTPGGTVMGSAPYTTTVTGGSKQTVSLNISLPPGTYRMGQLAPALLLTRNSAGAVYPYTSPGINILSNNFNVAYYYYFYNWSYGSGCESPRQTVAATIQPASSATLSYPGTPFCGTSGTVNPTLVGTYGGKYSSTSGLSIDTTTGVINLANSSLGTYIVTYTVAANGSCPVFTTTAPVVIASPPSATINYAGSPYCTGGGQATVTLTGTSGGIFSSTAGLIINSNTGTISLANSTPGTYTVQYTVLAAGSCPSFNTSTTVTITQSETASITYVGSPFCTSEGTINPNRTGSANGTYSSTAGLSIDANTGAINLGASLPGSYTISYTIAATSNCPAFVTTYNIVIIASPTATVQYSANTFCLGSGSATPTVNSTATGTFSSSAGLVINSSTGQINLATSTAGTYTVNYVIVPTNGCPNVVVSNTITLQAPATATISYASPAFCSNSGVKQVNRTGASDGKYSSSVGLDIDSITGAINTDNSAAGNYVVNYTLPASGFCGPVIISTNVEIIALPNSGFTYTVSTSNPLQYDFVSNTTSGATHLWNFGDTSSTSNTSIFTNPSHTFTEEGTYIVSHKIVTTINGCENTTLDTVLVTSIGVSRVSKSIFNFNAYPNPYVDNTLVVFELNDDAKVSLEVYDLVGKKINTIVENQDLRKGKHQYNFNEDLQVTNGVYLLKLNVDGQSSVLRVMQLK